MRLICPNCVAQYEVDDNVIPPEGRDVQCANCGHNWFQDSVQMLSIEPEIPSGTGDPESDVPPELFNDLEGKLDTTFTSTRANVAPDPNDMDPENPRDDFQIEQQPDKPSSRLGKDALDILHAEAEYSSGKKPPATADKEDTGENETDKKDEADKDEPDKSEVTPEDTDKDTGESVVPEKPKEPAEQPAKQPGNAASEPPEADLPSAPDAPNAPSAIPAHEDLDEIRRRIMELETVEDQPDQLEQIPTSEPEETVEASAPPSDDTSVPDESAAQSAAPRYKENIPVEQEISDALNQNEPVAKAIETFVEEQDAVEVIVEKPRRRITPRQFPNIGDISDELYGASKERVTARKDMLPDVDVLSSEIATEAEQGGAVQKAGKSQQIKSKGGFLTGFKYAILLCILVAIVYLMQSTIVEYVPQSAGFIKALNGYVDTLGSLLSPVLDKIKGYMP